ncbi:type II secretion system F family protein [Comamonas terrae]|uniref:Type II secretion system F family protein n=1 Tax=Comamonas terrae TaxID=673548 RepID=A0ABW5ULJ0_9BURK|nr:type II secretion system F family protein [Comamonas terrae]
MTPQQLWTISLSLGALGIALLAGNMIWRLRRSALAAQRVENLLHAREASAQAPASAAASAAHPFNLPGSSSMPGAVQNGGAAAFHDLAASVQPPAWLDKGIAKALLADEDRKLLDQAGISLRNGSVAYIGSRIVLAAALPLLALLVLQPSGSKALIYGFLSFGFGLMLRKWLMQSKARQRRRQVVEELPLFVDLLRLLQGVGLSIDQSLQILATEFGSVLPVLSGELTLANQLYASGRSREQSFQRLTHLSADEDMSAVVNLLVQVDRHGGAVQEPLREFGVRLREKRQAGFKEKIGSITVKMTGVMVLTLLPALLVITAGPGFMAVIRSLSSMGGR